MPQNLPNPAPYAGGPVSLNSPQAGEANPADTKRNAACGSDLSVPGSGRDSSAQGQPIANSTNTQATYEADQRA